MHRWPNLGLRRRDLAAGGPTGPPLDALANANSQVNHENTKGRKPFSPFRDSSGETARQRKPLWALPATAKGSAGYGYWGSAAR